VELFVADADLVDVLKEDTLLVRRGVLEGCKDEIDDD